MDRDWAGKMVEKEREGRGEGHRERARGERESREVTMADTGDEGCADVA